MKSCERKRKRKRTEELWTALREAQRDCACNNKTIKTVLKTVEQFLAKKGNGQTTDGATGTVVLELNGCVNCDDHVFLPSSTQIRCPKCNHPRFNRQKKPNEIFWYFPLKNQLASLLQNSKYRDLLMWETRRGHHPGIISDIYDTPRQATTTTIHIILFLSPFVFSFN